jgi:gamma-glutamyltranspeptidase / glutathione hydrolase
MPLKETFRDETLMMNPPPSSGGSMILFALKLMEKIVSKPDGFHDPDEIHKPDRFHKLDEDQKQDGVLNPDVIQKQDGFHKQDEVLKPDQRYIEALAEVQFETEKRRLNAMEGSDDDPLTGLIETGSLVEQALNAVKNRLNVSRGTTHISIIDADGNMASLTTSNGEGSGILIPGTGVMMNNMLGEEDLNPAGLQKWQQNRRMTSMMSPGILVKQNGSEYVFGSGGSSRIRTALLQVILNLIDFRMSPHEAVHAPRIHAESDFLNIEPGFTTDIENYLLKRYPKSKRWESQSLYFGGTHIVSRKGGQFTGTGDPRRGGVYIQC